MADEQEDMTPEQMAQLQKENCIFCKIISGDIPSKRVYEDTDFVGILDINPAAEGHVLLLPKQHFQILPQIPQELVGNLGIACANVSSKVLKAFKCDGTTVFMANGAIAGQRAPHFMVHIIPRKENDDISLNPQPKEIDSKLFDSIKEKLFSSLKKQPSPQIAPKSKEIEEEQEEQKDDVQERFRESEEEKKQELVDAASKSKSEEESKRELNKESTRYEREEEQKESIQKTKPVKKKATKSKKDNSEEELQPTNQGIDFDKLTRLFR